ncbi:hypothetical protein GCM10011504_07340 [Siccirubricoccus deserti]|nr:hypothetical protein GCM10011504_07340 [Siccirubricoccus deserti]
MFGRTPAIGIELATDCVRRMAAGWPRRDRFAAVAGTCHDPAAQALGHATPAGSVLPPQTSTPTRAPGGGA